MDEEERKALSDIEEYGCHILHVLEEDELPGFSYSIGIQKTTGQPELIVTGLRQHLAHWIINEYNTRIRNGEAFLPDNYYDGFIENYPVTFKQVQEKKYAEYLGWARWLYDGNGFNTLQLIYPSKFGLWPWDKEAPKEFTFFIPRLYQE